MKIFSAKELKETVKQMAESFDISEEEISAFSKSAGLSIIVEIHNQKQKLIEELLNER